MRHRQPGGRPQNVRGLSNHRDARRRLLLMSTKQSLLWHYDFELYRDYLDEGFVWIAVRGAEFEASSSEVRVKLPAAVWEVLRRAPGVELDSIDLTEEQIAQQVQTAVDQRLRDHDDERKSPKMQIVAFSDVAAFGSIEGSREEQVAKGIAYYRAQRERQRRIATEIAEIESETNFRARTNAAGSSPGQVLEMHPLKAARVRGEAMKHKLLQECGALSLAEVAELLDVSPEAVDSLRRERKLIAVFDGVRFIYPSVQFEGRTRINNLSLLLQELGSSSWMALAFLVAESEHLGGRSPVHVLKSGTADDIRTVFRMARIAAGDGYG